MKPPKPIVIKSVTGSIATGVLLSSCLNGYNFEDSYYGAFAENLDQSKPLFDLNESNLSDEFLAKMQFIQQFLEVILKDNKEARRFAKNPHEYITSKEKSINIELQEPERRLLIAFADDDILKAVKTNDVESFLSLCSERGYLGIINDFNKPQNIREMSLLSR
ncbi:hypothetical protein [Proteiniphilum propionicum]|jgi:hypothetical protein|uniref:hypothetical protein n=1 Tax=Proteiniphilum propionicum TaxID=2829812 RepID=UPI001EEB6303|nr:hypothetical protein [Proteiniphilum propionicum]MDD4754371.1 hypothetical protein [Desulfitobacteriaceae bacterium]ULB35528.1 hypothetical protein KDN43_05690 [Proteiniphilum propionicum]